MELSAVLSLRDKLSAQMNKASKSVSAMTDRVNESREAITKIAATQGINISAKSNIADIVSVAKTSIISLQNTIAEKEIALQTKIDLDGFESKTINTKLNELSSYLDKNATKVEEYNNKLAILRQKQSEFTDGTKGSVKLGVEQSIESLEKKLAEIEAAKQQFAEWQQISLDYNDLELARAELATLETAVDNLNSTNVAVRAYIDFKNDALQQVYDIDEKLKSLGKKIISPLIKLKDQATEKINGIKEHAKNLVRERFSPVISAIDKARTVMSSVRTGLAKIAGTVAYPIIKAKDVASAVIGTVKTKLQVLKDKIITPEVRLKAQQAFNTIKELGNKLTALGSKATKVFANAAGALAKGLMVSVGVAVTAISGIGAAAINVGAQFETSMSQVAATMGMTADEANYSNEVYAKLANTAKRMGASTKFSASEAGDALNFLALAGYDADKACAALPTILNLAVAGSMDLAAASDMVTDSMSALGIAATEENLTKFGDQLAKTAQKSNTSVAQLGEAILTVGGTGKTLAGGTTELNALLGIIADNGVKGSEGGTKLRNIMLSLQAPTDIAAKKMKALGISVYDAQGKMRPMNDILGDLNSSMSNMTDAQKQDVLSTIFNKGDLKSVNALLDNCGARFDELSGYIENSDGAMQDMADTMNNNLTGRITEFKSALEGAGIAIYEAIGSSNLKDLVKEASGWIGELTSATEENGIDGLVGAIGTIFSKIISKITSLTPTLIQTGIGIVTSLISGIKENLPSIVSGLSGAGTLFVQGIFNLIPQVLLAGGDLALQLAKGVTEQLPTILDSGIKSVEQLVQGIVDGIPVAIEVAIKFITTLANGIVKSVPKLLPAVTKIIKALSTALTENLNPILNVAIEILETLMDGLIIAIPELIPIVIQVLLSFVEFITENLGAIAEAALTILMALVQGLVASIPVLIPAIVDIILNIIQFISDNLSMILEAGVNIVLVLTQGLVQNIPLLVDGIIKVMLGIVDFITNNLPMILEAAIQIIFALVEGLIKAIPDLIDGAMQLVKAIWDTITSTNWLQLGIDLIKGVGNGLIEGVKAIGETIGNVANSIVDKFKNFLGIHSPSRVMKAEVGINIGAGVAEGLKETKAMVNNEIENLTDDMSIAMNKNIVNKEELISEVYKPKTPKELKIPREISNSRGDIYEKLDIAQPISNNNTTASYSSVENTSKETKKYYIEKLIENITVTNEADENRLVQKILVALADDIEETAANMGEDDFD